MTRACCAKAPVSCSCLAARRGLHWLAVKERVDYKLAVITRMARTTGRPSHIAELLVSRVQASILRSSADTTQLAVPQTRNKRAMRSFHAAAPSV